MTRFQALQKIGLRVLATIFTIVFWVGYADAQQVFVSSRNTNSVKHYDLATGNFLGDFITAGSGGLSFPQEVVWHPDGFLLVTGRGNTAVKKYDSNTGAYLGDFTSGYALDNPTKTTIWNDSLLYVSQWGATKNKVARFDLKTGAFVDEFTSAGIPNGCGHAWDTAGYLLVAQFGNGTNGKVWKFNSIGAFVGDFIPSTLLQGPVNVWFDAENHLFVADWTLGEVMQFDGATGEFQSKLVTGLANVEGYDFDNQGNLYLCDWATNKIFRYRFETDSLEPFIQSGGLIAPNSILIREPASSPTKGIAVGLLRLSVSPNPADSFLQVSYFLEKTATVQVDILNLSGQNVAMLFSGKQIAGKHQISWDGFIANGLKAKPGTYFVRCTVDGGAVARKLVWQQP
ncbi:MAG: T9SS C-terminal target domain-containing protein [Haliscomenobacteraceae bacterium CHB4]|nr:hypothetical protein [Saprospiraceae bacterium]MCE7924738.1 T9SS C-terminal target domain-containing protein [Haliscomenobacteraceae bacterium CHB4]